MNFSSQTVFTIWAAVVFTGCASSQREKPANPTSDSSSKSISLADFVVFDWRIASSAWGFPQKLTPSWNPTDEQVHTVVRSLPDFLRHASRSSAKINSSYRRHLPDVINRLPQTLCQGIGVNVDGQDAILLNCLPQGSPRSEGWKEHFIRVYDGGPRYWHVVYQLDTQDFTHLRIDQGF